jgi:riboflavin transporter FmnP
MSIEPNTANALSDPNGVRDLAMAGCLLAASVAVPIVFHLAGLGQVFLPMHIPVLIAGLTLRPRLAVAVGLLAPLASMFITGMPPAPFAVVMTIELSILALVASVLSSAIRAPVWGSAICAVLARCVATAIVTVALARMLHLPPPATGIAAVVVGVPGIALQLVAAIPAAMWLRAKRGARAATWV